MSTRIGAVLCELEGVLADTASLRAAALGEAFASLDVPLSDGALDQLARGRTTADAAAALARHAGMDDDAITTIATLDAERRFSARLAGGVLLAPGAADFVRVVREAMPIAVVTRARRADAELILELGGLSDQMTFMIAADDVVLPKPDPASHRLALARLTRSRGLAADQVIALEDGVSGLAAARAAGLRCVAVGAVAPEELFGADGWFPSLEHLSVRAISDLLQQA